MATFVGLSLVAAVALSDLMHRSPASAGEILLADKDHEEVVAVVDPKKPSMIPRQTEKIFRERARRLGPGCVKRSWRAVFRSGSDASESDAYLVSVDAFEEVQASASANCDGQEWVRVAGDDPLRALSALEKLAEDLRGPGFQLESCRDETTSQLCASDAATLGELRSLVPWLVGVREGRDYVWLSSLKHSYATDITLGPNVGDGMVVVRTIPAPF